MPEEIRNEVVQRQERSHDKKRHGNTVNLVVPREIGRASLRTVTLAELGEVIRLGCGV